jgi:hypothetical protein
MAQPQHINDNDTATNNNNNNNATTTTQQQRNTPCHMTELSLLAANS